MNLRSLQEGALAGNRCDGRGWPLIPSDDDGIAIMIEDCGALDE